MESHTDGRDASSESQRLPSERTMHYARGTASATVLENRMLVLHWVAFSTRSAALNCSFLINVMATERENGRVVFMQIAIRKWKIIDASDTPIKRGSNDGLFLDAMRSQNCVRMMSSRMTVTVGGFPGDKHRLIARGGRVQWKANLSSRHRCSCPCLNISSYFLCWPHVRRLTSNRSEFSSTAFEENNC